MSTQVCISVVYLHASVCKCSIYPCKLSICSRKRVYVQYMSMQVCVSVVYVHASVVCVLTSVCKFNICPRKCV